MGPMLASAGKCLRVLVAAANVLGVMLGTGLHLHLLLEHEHEGDRAHRHIAVVHSHDGIADLPGETAHRQPAGEHRHHVPLMQIVALQPVPMQVVSFQVGQLEAYTLHNADPSPDCGMSRCANFFFDTSPPFEQQLAEEIPGRSPPLL